MAAVLDVAARVAEVHEKGRFQVAEHELVVANVGRDRASTQAESEESPVVSGS